MDDVAEHLAVWDAYSMRSTLNEAIAKGDDAQVLTGALTELPDVDALDALKANAEAVKLLVGRQLVRDARCPRGRVDMGTDR